MALSWIKRFIALEAASSLILLGLTVIAMAWANSPFQNSYQAILHFPIGPYDLHFWINDGLMAIFFFVVGLEIKRELTVGELASPRKAALPILAAAGGMIVPAAIYTAFNFSGPGAHGWGIPMATDIAFAMGVLALSGRVPFALKVFLLALAIVDDLGAVLVIAIFYTTELSLGSMALALLATTAVVCLRAAGVRLFLVYWIVGALLWWAVLKSGVHATVAGVVLGLLTPAKPLKGETKSPLEVLVEALHPWVNYLIMPVFALANAGVVISSGTGIVEVLHHPVSVGVILGLFFGKPMGILLACWLGVKFGVAQLPHCVSWRQLLAVGFIAGIGFTMALFISGLALRNPDLEAYSKLGILIGSTLSALVGFKLLRDIKA